MGRCLSCSCDAELHRSMLAQGHVYIYCTECNGKGVRQKRVSMMGMSYETYCYVVGPAGGLWGGSYFEADRHVRKWPTEMRQTPRPEGWSDED